MKPSEITEEDGDEFCNFNKSVQRDRIRRIIDCQKSLYLSSSSASSFSSATASCSSFSSCRRTSLLDRMKEGSTSLRRLFDMEHTPLSKHFDEYSGSPIIKPIFLWGSEEDEAIHGLSPWAHIKKFQSTGDNSRSDGIGGSPPEGSFAERRTTLGKKKEGNKRRFARKKSYRNLPGFSLWRWRGIRLKLRRLKIMICGRKIT